jgi:hypothetical protein
MTAKEKAKELVDKYINIDYGNVDFYDLDFNYLYDIMHYDPKKYALIAVDEIIKVVGNNSESHIWMKVKQEIKKL